jgi:hypothetical protein
MVARAREPVVRGEEEQRDHEREQRLSEDEPVGLQVVEAGVLGQRPEHGQGGHDSDREPADGDGEQAHREAAARAGRRPSRRVEHLAACVHGEILRGVFKGAAPASIMAP